MWLLIVRQIRVLLLSLVDLLVGIVNGGTTRGRHVLLDLITQSMTDLTMVVEEWQSQATDTDDDHDDMRRLMRTLVSELTASSIEIRRLSRTPSAGQPWFHCQASDRPLPRSSTG